VPFASIAVNIPSIWCLPHKDDKNLKLGLYCIVLFKEFNSKKKMQIVLEEASLEVEVAARVSCFILSALFTHYNTILLESSTYGSVVF
jgi:hypothetical protein